MSGKGSTANVIAAICNVCFFGLGQLVQGRIIAAVFFAVITYSAYWLAFLTFGLFYIVAIPLHIWCILNAALYKGD